MRALTAASILASILTASFEVAAAPDVEGARGRFEAAFAARFGAPGEACDDATFLRRAALATQARLPTPAELEAFLAEPDRPRAIARLLGDARCDEALARGLTRRLIGPDARDQLEPLFERWAQRGFARDATLSEQARALVAAEGRVGGDDWGGLFLLQYRGDPANTATAVARNLLGLSLDCARCHDHPFADWRQEQFHAFAASFGRLRLRRIQQTPPSFELLESPIGEYRFKLHGQARAAAFAPSDVDGRDLSESPKRRRALVEGWLGGEEGPSPRSRFVRAQANRIYAELFGVAALGDVADLPDGASPLLDRLAELLIACELRPKAFRAALMATQAWQRGAELRGDDPLRPRLRRPLGADAWAGSFAVALGRDVPGPGEPAFLHAASLRRLRDELRRLSEAGPEGAAFGSSARQALHLLNGAAPNALVEAGPRRVVGRILGAAEDDAAAIRALCKRLLIREPSAAELERWGAFLAAGEDREARFEDLAWALVASYEFACHR